MSTKFAVNDRVVVAETSPLTNLVGREGTIVAYLPEDVAGPEMWHVLLDNMRLFADVSFFESELVNLSKES